MDGDRFTALCRELGHDPECVLSIRVNPRETVVTYIDETGTLTSRTACPDRDPVEPPSLTEGAPAARQRRAV